MKRLLLGNETLVRGTPKFPNWNGALSELKNQNINTRIDKGFKSCICFETNFLEKSEALKRYC